MCTESSRRFNGNWFDGSIILSKKPLEWQRRCDIIKSGNIWISCHNLVKCTNYRNVTGLCQEEVRLLKTKNIWITFPFTVFHADSSIFLSHSSSLANSTWIFIFIASSFSPWQLYSLSRYFGIYWIIWRILLDSMNIPPSE